MSSLSDIGTGLGAAGDLLGGITGFMAGNAAASGYKTAASIAQSNARLTAASTGLQVLQQQRQAYQVLGGQKRDVAAAGLANSGSALDVMRSSARDAAINEAVTNEQGQINVNDYLAKSSEYSAEATASQDKGTGGLLGGILGAASAVLSFL